MKTKYKRKWIKALRSGKYEQTPDYLRYQSRYCCLGVLCDLVKEELGTDWDSREEFLGCVEELPREVVELTGLPDRVGSYQDLENTTRSLAEDNDLGKTFKQIANIIERRF